MLRGLVCGYLRVSFSSSLEGYGADNVRNLSGRAELLDLASSMGCECRTTEERECLAGDNQADARLDLESGQLASSVLLHELFVDLSNSLKASSARYILPQPVSRNVLEPRKEAPWTRHPWPGHTYASAHFEQHR